MTWKPETPALTVDILIRLRAGGVVLIERKNPPHGYALPGGFVDVGESAEVAAIREAKEETGLDVTLVRQFHVYSDPARDARMHTVSVVFVADADGVPVAQSDAKGVLVIDPANPPSPLCFDHGNILRDYVEGRH
ncbi:MAG: NUDIX hydrolase [Deltaproteobacteria bacterium]|nr:NUDIX hydrolase [Deltaproteobacteria bacterium]